jgi:hypothetical protein
MSLLVLAGSNVNGNGHVAVGHNAGSGTTETQLVSSNTVAIGEQAVAIADGGLLLGMERGQRAQTNLCSVPQTPLTASPVLMSRASRAAMGGPVQIVTADADGNLVTNTATSLELATISDVNALRSLLTSLEGRLKEFEERIQKSTR